MEMTFLFKPVKWENITKNVAPQNERHTAKLIFSGVTFQKEAKNSTRRNFSKRVWKGENLEERFWFDGNNFFCSKQWNATITDNYCSSKLATYIKIKHFYYFEAFLRKLINLY